MVKKNSKKRKQAPVYTGFLRYFPKAILAIANCSWVGNEQHNPGTVLHWDREKSGDELDALARHLLDGEKMDNDDILHASKIAWRAMANLEKLLERREKRGT